MKTISAAELKEKAKQLRKTAVTMIYEAQSGHPGGSLSIADIVADLYFREMNVDPKNPRWRIVIVLYFLKDMCVRFSIQHLVSLDSSRRKIFIHFVKKAPNFRDIRP